ncbi:GNAT family N-acetyltransferase [Nocardia arthritidis]|uniref:GNAT family N-acetyltransferase n=1 Tax=Nocardia arthritidis TaxID=228602 RepID=UPI00142D1E63|nr:GNAT family N-acetyltransferase [Nocardia arthritidis]
MKASAEISEFDANQASDADLADYHRLVLASSALDKPDQPPMDRATAVGDLQNPPAAYRPPRYWAAHAAGRLVGFARVGFLGAENTHLGITEIMVHPEFRRRRIGTGLLATVVSALRADGRRLIQGWAVPQGGAGALWAASLGFRQVHSAVSQRLVFAEVDSSIWEVDTPPGYRLERWIGAAPEKLVTSYAHAKGAILDLPGWDLMGYQIPDWTAGRVRQEEAHLREMGIETRVVVAVSEETGAVAGITELMLYPHNSDQARQGDTAVLAEHRGHGLGRCMKARMVRWVVADKPRLKWIITSSATTNSQMIRVNHQIGYRTVRNIVTVEHDVATLESELQNRKP